MSFCYSETFPPLVGEGSDSFAGEFSSARASVTGTWVAVWECSVYENDQRGAPTAGSRGTRGLARQWASPPRLLAPSGLERPAGQWSKGSEMPAHGGPREPTLRVLYLEASVLFPVGISCYQTREDTPLWACQLRGAGIRARCCKHQWRYCSPGTRRPEPRQRQLLQPHLQRPGVEWWWVGMCWQWEQHVQRPWGGSELGLRDKKTTRVAQAW